MLVGFITICFGIPAQNRGPKIFYLAMPATIWTYQIWVSLDGANYWEMLGSPSTGIHDCEPQGAGTERESLLLPLLGNRYGTCWARLGRVWVHIATMALALHEPESWHQPFPRVKGARQECKCISGEIRAVICSSSRRLRRTGVFRSFLFPF